MATKEEKDVLAQLEDDLAALEKLLHENFPLGGHANVEAAQQRVNNMRRTIKGAK